MKELIALLLTYILIVAGLLLLICVTVETYLNGQEFIIIPMAFVCSMLIWMLQAISSIMRDIK